MKLLENSSVGRTLFWLAALAAIIPAGAEGVKEAPVGMISIARGSYKPLYSKESEPRAVFPFFIDERLVTNRDFLAFVTGHPEWKRSKIERTQADVKYLSHWRGDLDPGDDAVLDAPVTNVSWFAAKAYCESQGKRLPTQDEWEFVALADATRPDASKDQEFLKKLLEWYSKPSGGVFPPAATAEPNVYGIRGLHGLAWEWVQDFNSTMVVGDSRGDNSLERNLFCGGASLLASDVSNYSAFMRYAFRSSLKGTYCVNSLGFRGAQSLNGPIKNRAGTGFATIYDLPEPWTNQNRETITLKQLGGKTRVIAMGYTSCIYACSRIFSDMQQIEKSLGVGADKVGFVFFSIDPEHDTPETMAAKMAELELDPERWTILAAPVETVRTLAVALDFKFEEFDGFFAHSNLIAVVDPEGKIAHREESLGVDISPSVAVIRKLIAP